MTSEGNETPRRSAVFRIAAATAVAALLALIMFLLLERFADRGDGGSGALGFTFLFVVPAALSAFTSYASDPMGTEGQGHYAMVPCCLVGLSLLAGFVLMREGIICIAMLAPVWLAAGLIGSFTVYGVRKWLRGQGRQFCFGVLMLPLLAAQAEANAPLPVAEARVTREISIDAPPEAVWPLLVALPRIGPDEGRWNIAQDVLGVPRPRAALLTRRQGGAVRIAEWQHGVRFEERISILQHLRAISWRFNFPDDSVQRHTDRHISPDGAHLRIAEGGYRLERLSGGRTRLLLETHYLIRSPVNFYGAWWGELLLGGIQDNVLATVRARAEAAARQSSGSTNAIMP